MLIFDFVFFTKMLEFDHNSMVYYWQADVVLIKMVLVKNFETGTDFLFMLVKVGGWENCSR